MSQPNLELTLEQEVTEMGQFWGSIYLSKLSVAERLAGLSTDDRLIGLKPEEVLSRFKLEEVLMGLNGLSLEEIEAYLQKRREHSGSQTH